MEIMLETLGDNYLELSIIRFREGCPVPKFPD
jgi:hypothetical protein